MNAPRLARLRRRARLILTLEALAVAALLPLAVIALFLIATLLGFGGWIADAIAIAALIATIHRARRHHASPSPAAIDRRIERDSRLGHRPIAAWEDHPALIGADGSLLWHAHRTRLERALAGARVGRPAPDFAAHDPFALRALLLLALIAAWIAAGPAAGSRLGASLALPHPFSTAGIGVSAWITPPRWTGEGPRLVAPGKAPIHALTGSRLSLIVTVTGAGAGADAPYGWIGDNRLAFATIDTGSYRATQALTAPTTITIGPFWHRIARYHLLVASPVPPRIDFTGTPEPDADGKRLDLSWQADSRYNLRIVALHTVPTNAPSATEQISVLPPGHAHGQNVTGQPKLDLLANPYAGMAVSGVLTAENQARQDGRSSPVTFILPAPILHNATARALEALRRTLALTPQLRPALASALGDIATHPPGQITTDTQHAIASFATDLARNDAKAAHPEATLWTLVQRAELGAFYQAARRLDAAQRALEHALDRALAGHAPDHDQLRRLLARLNQVEQSRLVGQAPNQQPGAQSMQMSTIDRLAEKIAHEAAAGQTQQAKADMTKLREMLRRMQSAQPMSAAEQDRQRAEQQAAQSLSKLMRQEAGLMNRTSHAARQYQPSLFYNNVQQQAQRQQAAQPLVKSQAKLANQLQSAAATLQQQGVPQPGSLSKAASGMKQAVQTLAQGDYPGALSPERTVIASLQQAQGALRSMQTGHGTGNGPSGLGRHASGGHGQYGNQNRSVLDLGRAGAHSEARQIQDELIRRDAAPNLPPLAHDYYHRLLGSQF